MNPHATRGRVVPETPGTEGASHFLAPGKRGWLLLAPPFAPRKVLHDAASPAPNRKRPWQRQPPLENSEALSGRFNRVTGEIRIGPKRGSYPGFVHHQIAKEWRGSEAR